jgi:hypothetical protein
MANAVYPLAKQAFLSKQIDLTSDTIKVALLTSAYTYSAAHQYVTDLGANIVARTAALTGKTVTNGIFNAASPATASAVTGSAVAKLAVFQDTGTDSTARLIQYIDTVTSGLPVTPNGGDINVNLDTGANKIFAL